MALLVLLALGLIGFGVTMSHDWVMEGKNVVVAMLIGLGMVGIPVGWGVAALTSEIQKPATFRSRVVVTAVATVLAVAGTWIYALGAPVNRPDERILAAMAPVCRGGTVAAAGGYPAAGANHVVLLQTDGQPHDWAGKLPSEWKPTSVADTALVACAQNEVQLEQIEVCEYEGPDITRYLASLDVRLIAARTGEVIGRRHLEARPRECMGTERSSTTELTGSLEAENLVKALTPYVDPKGVVEASDPIELFDEALQDKASWSREVRELLEGPVGGDLAEGTLLGAWWALADWCKTTGRTLEICYDLAAQYLETEFDKDPRTIDAGTWTIPTIVSDFLPVGGYDVTALQLGLPVIGPDSDELQHDRPGVDWLCQPSCTEAPRGDV
jgi:hypothetical protein